MSARDLADPARLLRMAQRLGIIAQVFGFTIHGALIATMWGTAIAPWLFAAPVIVGTVNMALALFGPRRLGHERAKDVRAMFNVAFHAPLGALCGWPLAAWLFVPFVVALSNVPPTRHPWRRPIAMLAVFDAVGLVTGARVIDVLLFNAMAVFIHLVIDAYLDLANRLLEDRDRALVELHAAQRLALGQERLASVGQLAAGVAHEINNPMCFVTANVSDLLDDLRREPELSPALAEYRDLLLPETLDGIARVNTVVGDIRRFAGGEPERPVVFDLAEEVVGTTRLCKTQLGAGQRLHVDLIPELWLRGSPRQIAQLLLNLIVNAIQALPGVGDVWVRGRVRGGEIELSVTDSGRGMTADTLQRVFEPFFTTRAPGTGTGLGLAVVHGVAAAHGGRVEVESTPGRGSRFRVLIPRAAAPGTADQGRRRTSRRIRLLAASPP